MQLKSFHVICKPRNICCISTVLCSVALFLGFHMFFAFEMDDLCAG
jgi:hypothetical protein